MTLDAFVVCNCYKEGKTTPFPLPELVKYLNWNEDGYLRFDLPIENSKEAHEIYRKWEQKACKHEYMYYARECISNWAGYRLFQQALAQIGWEHLPTLRAELPEFNAQGHMLAEASAQMLVELASLKARENWGTNVFLIDSETGKKIHSYIAVYQGVLMADRHQGVEIGFDPHGFFIREMENEDLPASLPRREFFRAMGLEQRLLSNDENGYPLVVEYYNPGTGERFDSATGITSGGVKPPWKCPSLMHVEERPIGPNDFAYVIEPLEIVCKASVETGNAVIWS